MTKVFLNLLKLFLPFRMQVCLMRLTPQGILALYDRARKRKIIVFHLALVGQAVYINPIINEMILRREKISIYLVLDKDLDATKDHLSQLTGISSSKILYWNRLNSLGVFDVFITPTQWIPNQPTAKLRICIFHGLPTKGNTFQPELMHRFNVLFFLGPLHNSLFGDYAEKHPDAASSIRTFDVGYPKSDNLINGHFSKTAVVQKYRLDPMQPIILYAPAFDNGTSLDMYGEKVIENLLKLDANVIVKLHPMCYDPRYYPGGMNWSERLKQFQNNPRFRHVGNQPLDPFLAASDILVTDVSGAALEFILLNKPVIFIDCPDFFKNTLGQPGYERTREDVLQDIRANAGRCAGIVVPYASHLPEAINRTLQHPSEFESQRLAVRQQLLYNPGNATHVAVDTLIEIAFE